MSELMDDKKGERLHNIAFLRVVAITGVVLYHSFSVIYNLVDTNGFFNLIFKQTFMVLSLNMAMLPLFVFISGYLFSYSQSKVKRNFKGILINKARRLLLPYFVFALLFSFLTPGNKIEIGFIARSILTGAGHLWFLLALFICFTMFSMIQKNKLFWILLITLYVTYFVVGKTDYTYLNKLFSFERFLIFFPWFCIGFFVRTYQGYLKLLSNPIYLVLIAIIYLAFVSSNIFYGSIWIGIINDYKSYIAQLVAVILLWLLSNKIVLPENSRFQIVLSKLDNLSFGVYIFHMWIIHSIVQNAFTKDIMISLASQYQVVYAISLFAISFILSTLITVLVKRTNIGRTLLG
jgi:surface polysaccharide O-acyltransferase-like enzyme